MANATFDLAELIRETRRMLRSVDPTEVDSAKLDCYLTIISKLPELLDKNNIQTIIPIYFAICPIEEAKKYVIPLGMNIVIGSSGTAYLSFAKKLG